MLFNSYIFIFLFLPVTVALFHVIRNRGDYGGSVFVLVLASLMFYGWWNPVYLGLLIPLIFSDYVIAGQLIRHRTARPGLAKFWLALGLAINLGALCYFKYANFVVDNLNDIFGLPLSLRAIVLPIGISFFTFQKVAFLIDLYHGKVEKFNLLDYALFVTFFPQLIAGPIVHHSEVMPQFRRGRKITSRNFSLGITFFTIGLAKKVIVADTAARFASPYFNSVALGGEISGGTAWLAALAYTVQLYFDFSAYSDMAIGIGQFFGIHLPVNFNSPYKSSSISEFWRRWHITLSRFLRDYLYIPLGGNKKGEGRRYVNLFLTMLLGGIWHGAGWTFVIWGALHGVYLMINHAWRGVIKRRPGGVSKNHPGVRAACQVLTFFCVVIGWVFFRSPNVGTAVEMLKGMAGLNGWGVPEGGLFPMTVVLILLAIAFFMPNSQELTAYDGPDADYDTYHPDIRASRWHWAPHRAWAVSIGILFACCLMMFSQVSEFIYFQF